MSRGCVAARGPTAIFEARFSPRPRTAAPAAPSLGPGGLPSVTRLLVLAHKIDGMIRSSEIQDWAEAARLGGVTRARMTQVANLLLLAPAIQEVILDRYANYDASHSLTERDLRPVVAVPDWRRQALSFSGVR